MNYTFKRGDVVWAKREYVEKHETQESTMGIVLEYYLENDYLKLGVLNPGDYVFPPIFNARGCYYEPVQNKQ